MTGIVEPVIQITEAHETLRVRYGIFTNLQAPGQWFNTCANDMYASLPNNTSPVPNPIKMAIMKPALNVLQLRYFCCSQKQEGGTYMIESIKA